LERPRESGSNVLCIKRKRRKRKYYTAIIICKQRWRTKGRKGTSKRGKLKVRTKLGKDHRGFWEKPASYGKVNQGLIKKKGEGGPNEGGGGDERATSNDAPWGHVPARGLLLS